MAFSEKFQELVGRGRAARHLAAVRRHGIRSEDVMAVRVARRHGHASLDYAPSLVQLELGAFYVVGEIALEERERGKGRK